MMKSCSGLSSIHSVPRMTFRKQVGSDRNNESMLELGSENGVRKHGTVDNKMGWVLWFQAI